MNMGITKSVGRYGINARNDVIFIQTALNAYAKKHANNSFPLIVDGLCGEKTIQAIYNLQKNHLGISTPDARIEPNSRSLHHLTAITIQPPTRLISFPSEQNQGKSRVSAAKSMNEKIESLLKDVKITAGIRK